MIGGLVSNVTNKTMVNASGKVNVNFAKSRCCCDCNCTCCYSESNGGERGCAFSYDDDLTIDFGTITEAGGASGQPFYDVLTDLINTVSGQTLNYADYKQCPIPSIAGGQCPYTFWGQTIAQTDATYAYTWVVSLFAVTCQTNIPGCSVPPADVVGFSVNVYLVKFIKYGRSVGDPVPCNLIDWYESGAGNLTLTMWVDFTAAADIPCSDDCVTCTASGFSGAPFGTGANYINSKFAFGNIAITKSGYGPISIAAQPSSVSVPALCGSGGWTLNQTTFGCNPSYAQFKWAYSSGSDSLVIEAYTNCRWRLLIQLGGSPALTAYKSDGDTPIGTYIVATVGTCTGTSPGDSIVVT